MDAARPTGPVSFSSGSLSKQHVSSSVKMFRSAVDAGQVERRASDEAASSSDMMANVEARIPVKDLLVDSPDDEFFEQLGRTQSSLSCYSTRSLLKPRKSQRESSGGESAEVEALGDVTVLEDDEDNYDSDGEAAKRPEPSPWAAAAAESQEELLRPVASWVKSMNDFEMRKHDAEELVKQGVVYSELPEDHVVPIQQQVDLDLYTYEEQRRRWEAGQHPVFQSLCRDLWRLVRDPPEDENDDKEGGTLGREQYVELVYRFHYVCCPPPLEAAKVLQSTHDDWLSDSNGRETMDYAAFFRAIFQCVDIWTETSALKEYVALLKRLIAGAAVRRPDNTLQFKSKGEVKFDEYFGMQSPAPEARSEPSREPSSIVKEVSAQHIQAVARGKSQKTRYRLNKSKVLVAQRAIRTWLGEKHQRKDDEPAGTRATKSYKSPYSQQRRASVGGPPGGAGGGSVPPKRHASAGADPSAKRRRSRDQGKRFSAIDDMSSVDGSVASSGGEGKSTRQARKYSGPSEALLAADEVLHRKSSSSSSPASSSKKKKGREMLLSPEQTSTLIANCYKAKLQADAAASRALSKGKKYEKSVRFDLFVVRFFKRSHGTIGIARRHLRVFVRSIEALLEADKEQGDNQESRLSLHPRAALFAEIVGISNKHHNARLCPHFLVPVLRHLYPDVMKMTQLMVRRLEGTSEPVPLATMLDALQEAVPVSVRGAEITTLLRAAIEPAKIQTDAKLVDPDQALWLALPTFKTLDTLVAFRRQRSANVAQEYAKRYIHLRHAKASTDGDDGENLHRPLAAAENDARPDGALCTPAQKITEARDLDASLNPQAAEADPGPSAAGESAPSAS